MNGARLKLARVGAGLSLRKLSDEIGSLVSHTKLASCENNNEHLDSRSLMAVCLRLGINEDYLLGKDEISLEGVEWRKNRITSRREEAQVESVVIDRLQRYLNVEELLNISSRTWARPKGIKKVNELLDAETAANELRKRWDVGNNPIFGLGEFLEEKGIKVLKVKLPTSVSGLTCWATSIDGEKSPVIIINEENTGERIRFTMAHELGHMILDCSKHANEEKVAHRFAGAFLMPGAPIRKEVGTHRQSIEMAELFELKQVYGVSVQALAYRLKDLGIISRATLGSLFDEFEELGYRTPPYREPNPIKVESIDRFKRLCIRAFSEKAIDEAKVASLLGVKLSVLDEILGPPQAR